jgi:propanol-preferring alcohol dehydrogenase
VSEGQRGGRRCSACPTSRVIAPSTALEPLAGKKQGLGLARLEEGDTHGAKLAGRRPSRSAVSIPCMGAAAPHEPSWSASQTMRAMVLDRPGVALEQRALPVPCPGPGEVLLRVRACGLCRTDLHVVDGELTEPKLPLVPGHQVVGEVVMAGEGARRFAIGQRIGVPWLGSTCGVCRFCRSGRENLCERPRFTGYGLDGGFAKLTVADERFCLPLPEDYPDLQAAPLLCAGLIGYRALRMAGDGERLGLYGFGAAAHIVLQVALHQGRRVFAFTREKDVEAQRFARELGAEWAGDALGPPPEPLDAALIFAPAGELVLAALSALDRGGTVVCGGIHMSDIPSFPYRLLWEERTLRSVANLTRRDGEEFLALAPEVPVRTEVTSFALEEANEALEQLRVGAVRGAAVIVP